MEANKYQEQAMKTKMPTCDNLIYMMGLLHEEASELQGKLNKAQRKGLIDYDNNQIVWNGTLSEWNQFKEECMKELGDVCWAVAGIADQFGEDLGDVMQGNIDKLADRNKRGVIDGKGDNR
jgi:NTP pyrophosphatase (non-canonical NTP hydrolase)